ncbi:MAG: ATPase domain-containing protein [Candidatus Bathyarchaeia archaeon]
MSSNAEMISTGVEDLDTVLGGGFPKDSLIILAGNAGTGKTIFSAQFIYRGAVNFGENGVYASFSENRETFMINMKSFGFDFEGLEKDGRFSFLDLLTVKESAVSAVLDLIISEVERIKAKRLVIDSYTALVQSFKEPIDARIVLHVILGKLIRGMGCTTILIEEIPFGSSRIGLGIEEFVADGVIVLSANQLDGYRLRELQLLKLRGVMLRENMLTFTLKEGFKVFQPHKPKHIEKPNRFKPIPDTPGKHSTGTRSLDEVLEGGLPRGSVILMELDEKVPAPAYYMLTFPLVCNFLFQGRAVACITTAGVEPKIIYERLAAYGATPEEKSRNKIFITTSGTFNKLSDAPFDIINLEGKNAREDINKFLKVVDELTVQTNQPVLMIIGVDTLAALYGENQCEQLMGWIVTEARRLSAVVLAVTKAGRREFAIRLSPLADIYLRMTRKHGCPLIYGVKPRTGLYALEEDISEGYSIAKLTQIV